MAFKILLVKTGQFYVIEILQISSLLSITSFLNPYSGAYFIMRTQTSEAVSGS